MEELFKKAVAAIEAAKKTNVPWQDDVPYAQSYYAYNKNSSKWEAQECGSSSSSDDTNKGKVTSLALYAWNVDFMLPFPEERMTAALKHLEKIITPTQSQDKGIVIFLQECIESDLNTIQSNPWIQQNFIVTDTDNTNWASGHYGTTTLVSKNLVRSGEGVHACFRLHYECTSMERDILYLDIDIGAINGEGAGDKIIRVCNTHLESLANEPPLRPQQMVLASKVMNGTLTNTPGSVTPHGAILAGDFNAIQDFDRTLHSKNGLKDAYIELGGEEDKEEGYTWGQQAATVLREKFGCSRMDKVFFCGEGLKLNGFERFGGGVELDDNKDGKEKVQELKELGFEKAWITDHFGVKAEFEIC